MEIAKINLDGLPQELLDRLGKKQGPRGDVRAMYLAAVSDADGPVNVDYLLVHLYRECGKIYERRAIYQSLSRLTREGAIKRVGRGLYAKQD